MIDDSELSHDERAVIEAIGRIPAPQPPATLADTFRTRLQAERGVTMKARHRRWPLALAAGLALLFAAAWWLEWRQHQRVVTELRSELTAALADLSEARRFQAITTVGQSNVRDEKIVAALTTAMLTDPNTNVRVAAVEALAQVAKPVELFTASTQALKTEHSPFVLAALLSSTDRMPNASRKEFLRALLTNPHLLPSLRAQAESRIAS